MSLSLFHVNLRREIESRYAALRKNLEDLRKEKDRLRRNEKIEKPREEDKMRLLLLSTNVHWTHRGEKITGYFNPGAIPGREGPVPFEFDSRTTSYDLANALWDRMG